MDNSWECITSVVGGDFDEIRLGVLEDIVLVYNQEQNIKEMSPCICVNRAIVVGTVFIAKEDREEKDYKSLTPEEVAYIIDFLDVDKQIQRRNGG